MFPLQRLGAEVWAVHTVQFSSHPRLPGFAGQVFDGGHIAALLGGLEACGVLGRLDAILSGYLGDASTGRALLPAIDRCRRYRPDALFCCDPVIGDRGPGSYVRPGIADLIRDDATPRADLMTPNHWELELLTGGSARSLRSVADAARSLRARLRAGGPRAVLVTSVEAEETPEDAVDLVLASEEGNFLLRTPRLPISVNGAGDLIAALFLFHVLRTRDPRRAAEAAASAVWAVLAFSAAQGANEPLVVAAQDELVAPTRRFTLTAF